MRLTYVGGPTALIEWQGLRFLTDPTFDPAGTSYEFPAYTLAKTQGPAIEASDAGHVDAVLLSHDHHADNLDRAGRELLASADRVLTTADGAERLGGGATGLSAWERTEVGAVTVTATPARHGPEGGDRGPCIGFVLEGDGPALYFSGDTVFYEGVEEVAERFDVGVALLNVGAAKVAVVGDDPLTLTAEGAVEAARAMPSAVIVPLHFEGWAHFSEGRADVERAFDAAGMTDRLRWPPYANA